jgi:menaquinone-dependent protoporphyrinogen oxidase
MKILVTVASRHGATGEIGEVLASTLRDAGHDVESLAPELVTTMRHYDAIVIGSAVYTGRWLEPARRLAQRHHAELKQRPVWLFSSGPIGEPLAPTDEPRDGIALRQELEAREHRVFAGKLSPEYLGWVERTITSMLKAPDGDFRDWDEIRAWGDEIASALRTESDHPEDLAAAAGSIQGGTAS